jgi:hypothetical protein
VSSTTPRYNGVRRKEGRKEGINDRRREGRKKERNKGR